MTAIPKLTGIFSFDGPMYKDCNGVYCNTTITNEMFNRYFTVVDRLYVIIRTIKKNDTYINLNLDRVEVSDKLRIIELPNLNSPSEFIKRHSYLKTIEEYVIKSDLFFLRIPSIISNMVGSLCIKHKKPYFAEVGGCAWDSYVNHSLLGKLIAPYMYFKQKQVIRYATFCSYVTSKWLQQRYATHGKSIVASNVYLDSYDDQNIRDRCDKAISDNLKIGTIASLDVKYKGQQYVIKALKILKNRGYNLTYELVGTGIGEYLRTLAIKEGVSDQVKFMGVKLHKDIWKWLDQIDIYIQPSKQEGLPRALIEAMNRGCLTTGSTTAGIPELLEEDTVFKNASPRMIADIIEMLILEPDKKSRIIRNYEKSKEFSIDILNSRREQVYLTYARYVMDRKLSH